jgi:nucleoside 2-deoxyribosyltransferase
MKSVYLAGPYNSAPAHNTNDACRYAANLREQGFLPFVPHLFGFMDMVTPKPNAFWLGWCLDVLSTYPFDAVFVFSDGRSPGTEAEVALAEAKGIPVFRDYADLLTWREEPDDAA